MPHLDGLDAACAALPGDAYALPRLPECPPLFLLPNPSGNGLELPADASDPLFNAHAPRAGAQENVPQKRKQNQLSNGDRKWICKRKKLFPKETHSLLAEAFKVERNPNVMLRPSTISTIVKSSSKWLAIPDGKDGDKRSRPCQEPMLEAALLAWHQSRMGEGEVVADEQLKAQAKAIACTMGINTDKATGGLSFSSGWLCNFKKRNGLTHGRSAAPPRNPPAFAAPSLDAA